MTQDFALTADAGECYRAGPGSEPLPPAHAWTRDEVRYRFADAAETLKKLPLPKGGLPPVVAASWPDTVQEWLAYGWTATRTRRPAPSPEAITRLDEVLGWSHCLSADQRLVIWARAAGMTWKRVEWMDDNVSRRRHGRQQGQLRNILGDAEARILSKLNGTPPRMRLP